MNEHLIGKGGGGGHGGGGRGGGGRGGGGRGGGRGHHHGGGGRRGGSRFTQWGSGPGWSYSGPGFIVVDDWDDGTIRVDDLLDAMDERDQTKELAREIAEHLQRGTAHVGSDLDLLGAALLGEGGGFGDFGLSAIFNVAGNLAQAGVDLYDKEQGKQQVEAQRAATTAAEGSRLQAATVADAAWAQAQARAVYSARQKLPSAAVDASAAQQALSVVLRSGAGLSPESVQRRMAAAEQALAAATKKAQANPKDFYARATMGAWIQALARIQSGGAVPGAPGAPGEAPGGAYPASSWWDGYTGPVPNKVLAGSGAAAAALLLLGLAIRR